MAYDIEGARKAGVPDAEIASALAPKLNYDIDAARKAGVPDKEIADALAKRFNSAQAPAPKTRTQIILDAMKPSIGEANKIVEKAAYDAGGKVVDVVSPYVPPEAAAGLGFVTNVGVQAAPSIALGEVAKRGAPLLEKAAQRLMTSALKPSVKAVQTGKAAAAVDTLLKQGANVSESGVSKLSGKISSLNDEIATAIQQSPARVDTVKAAGAAQDVVRKFESQVDNVADLSAIERVVNNFLATHGKNLSVQDAQKIKQGTYRVLGDKAYGELGSATLEAQKAIARGLKDEIAAAVPKVGGLNKLESELINAVRLTARRVATEGNKNPVGLTHLSPSIWNFLSGIVDRSGPVKSGVANALYAGQQQIPATLGRIGGAMYGASLNRPPLPPSLERALAEQEERAKYAR